MKKAVFVLAAAGLITLAACSKQTPAENATDAAANASDAFAENLENGADNLSEAADNAHDAADAIAANKS